MLLHHSWLGRFGVACSDLSHREGQEERSQGRGATDRFELLIIPADCCFGILMTERSDAEFEEVVDLQASPEKTKEDEKKNEEDPASEEDEDDGCNLQFDVLIIRR